MVKDKVFTSSLNVKLGAKNVSWLIKVKKSTNKSEIPQKVKEKKATKVTIFQKK